MDVKDEKATAESPADAAEQKNTVPAPSENPMVKKRWFGRGIYGSKDVPIRILDGFILTVVLVIIVMIVYFAINGGFWVTFDTQGGNTIEKQKLRHGNLVSEPAEPVKPGYTFEGWYNQDLKWNFAENEVTGDLTLVASWKPAVILVKFDPAGGTCPTESKEVTFQELYGELPVPSKEGAVFEGWYYSGQKIEPDTQVQMTGEHVLTAQWSE